MGWRAGRYVRDNAKVTFTDSGGNLAVRSCAGATVTLALEENLATVQEKLAWLDAVRRRVQQFIDQGGDPKSAEAAPLAMALFHAINDLTSEFGIKRPKPLQSSTRSIKPEITTPYN